MTDHAGVTTSQTTRDRRPPVIETSGLTAEYSTGCTPTGEWFALGTIQRTGHGTSMPAWVVVGTGATVDEAVTSLTHEIRAQASLP